MEDVRKLVLKTVEDTFEKVVKNDNEYKKLENEKNEIIEKFKSKMTDKDYQELEKLIDCFEGQNFITAMGFSFVRVLDIEKLLTERI